MAGWSFATNRWHQPSAIGHRRKLEYPMPLFEYECRGCGKQFEYLTRADQTPSCPACHGVELQKLLSVFAAQSDSPAKSFKSMPPEPCGSCGDPRGAGACRTH